VSARDQLLAQRVHVALNAADVWKEEVGDHAAGRASR
jgi:hypothetical protein